MQLFHTKKWPIQDFPEVGAPTLRGCQHKILPNFPKNCIKLHPLPLRSAHAKLGKYKIAFQQDAYHPLADRISKYALLLRRGGAWSGGCLVLGGCLLGGGGCGIPACTKADPLPVNRITHACENTTLPQLRCGR